MKHKNVLRSVTVLAASLGLVALLCSSVAAAPRQQAHHASASGTVVVVETVGPSKLDPDVTTGFVDFQALGLVYDQLVRYNASLQFVPDLATSWTFSNGGKLVTFQLRKGVKFDDGSTFTSADVVASLERVIAPKTGDAASSYLSSVKSIVAKGPYTVELILSRPDTSILSGLTSLNLAILSTKAIKAGNESSQPDGTGPYIFSSWSPGNDIVLTANPNYWGGKVKIETIRVEAIPTEQSIAAAVEANTVQIGLLTEPPVVKTLSGYQTEKVLDLSYRTLMLQDRKGPLSNVNNRRAIACAINRQAVITDAVFGQGRAIGPVPLGPYAPKPVSALCPTPNLSMARNFLKKAGDPSGFTFTAIISTAIDPTDTAQSIVVQSELAKVGITMKIENLANNAYIQDWLAADFQAAFAWNGAYPDPYTMYSRYFGPGANLGGPAGYSSPYLQKEIVAGDEASNPAVRAADYAAFQANLTSNAVWIWLFTSYDYAVMAHDVHGFSYLPSYTDALHTLATASIS